MNGKKPLPSVSIVSKPEFCCIVANPKLGFGVYSWHMTKEEADFNSNLLGGVTMPVDYIDGNLITPPLAQAVIMGKDLNVRPRR